jgi:hypothetical protein
MIESGMVTSDQIEAAVAQQIEDAVFDLLRWDLGEFSWEAGAELEVEVPISVSVENLIMEASRRLDELEVIQRKIPGEHAVLMMAAAPPEGAAEINITPEEWRALVLVDGARTVGDIGQVIGKDDFETMKILYGLVSAGLVEVDHEATVAAETSEQVEEVEEVVDDSAAAEDVLEQAEAEVAETVPEVEVVAAEADVDAELADLLEDAPAAVEAPEAEAFEAEAPAFEEPEIEIVSASDASQEPVDISPETGVVGDEVIDAGEFDMSADELLASDPADTAEPAGEAEVEVEVVGAASNGVPDLTDGLEDVPAPPEDVSVPGFDSPEPPEAPSDEHAATETVSVGDADDPFLSDLLDQDANAPAPDDMTAPTAESAVEDVADEAAAEDSPTVDRAAVVRELAGLFDEDRPKARPSGPQAPPAPADASGDQRKRVEDDDQINKGVISRLIKGVKGL